MFHSGLNTYLIDSNECILLFEVPFSSPVSFSFVKTQDSGEQEDLFSFSFLVDDEDTKTESEKEVCFFALVLRKLEGESSNHEFMI